MRIEKQYHKVLRSLLKEGGTATTMDIKENIPDMSRFSVYVSLNTLLTWKKVKKKKGKVEEDITWEEGKKKRGRKGVVWTLTEGGKTKMIPILKEIYGDEL